MIEAVGAIAVVIAVRNEAERLPLLLADLSRGELSLAELVVVDRRGGPVGVYWPASPV